MFVLHSILATNEQTSKPQQKSYSVRQCVSPFISPLYALLGVALNLIHQRVVTGFQEKVRNK